MEKENKAVYEKLDVVQYYNSLNSLSAAETYIFEKYIPDGANVLDIGVGGGRTTLALSAKANRYLGIDYSAPMVESCKKKYPHLDFQSLDAKNLAEIESGTFNIVVFSFNGIDYLQSDAERLSAMKEIRRVLVQNGIFIFSTHHSQHLLIWPELSGANIVKKTWRCARAFFVSLKLLSQQICRKSFWNKGGYFFDPVHGGLKTHCSVPKKIENELSAAKFSLLEIVPDSFQPLPSFVSWYYFVARSEK